MILKVVMAVTLSLIINAEDVSEESDIVSSPEVEDDNSTNYNFNFGFTGALAGADQNSQSSSLSDERPLEDYVSEMDLEAPGAGRELKRKYWPGCKTKTERFCEKACRRSYRDVCEDYACRKSVRKAFKKACKHHCKSKFAYYIFIHEKRKPEAE